MTEDARFEDGAERPLRLSAENAEDVTVLSALLQDAVFPLAEIKYDRQRRELAFLANRFRWEDDNGAHDPERVQSVLVVRDVQSVSSQGFDRSDPDLVLSLLGIDLEMADDGSATILLTLAGDGAIRAVVECLNIAFQDVTRPYRAPSGKRPQHPE